MALTISQQPQLWTPAYNDQWITALSTQIAQPDFKYKVEVDIDYDVNGTPTTDTFTYYFAPRPDGYLVYNAKELVKNYIEHFIKPNDFNINECVNSKVDVTVVITEQWTGMVTPDAENVGYYAWNASLLEQQIASLSYGDYISTTNFVRVHSVATSGLNSYPFERQTLKADVYLQFVKPSTLDSINYKLIDTNGVDILNDIDIDLTGTSTNKIYQINVSPQLAEETWGGVTVGMYIQVDFFNATLDSLYTYTYQIEELCTKHDVNRVYYLNRRGGVSSFPFEMLSTKTNEIQTSEVRLGAEELTGGVYSKLPYQHEDLVVSTELKTKMTLQTNWITEQENIYLEELYSSPLKWVVNEEDAYGSYFNYMPVTSISKPFLLNKHANNKLFNYTIEVELSTQETRQRAI